MITDYNFAVALFTVRVIAGLLFFFQGYDKVFNIGMTQIRQMMKSGFGNRKIPDQVINFIAPLTSWIELLCGFLLILGFFKFFAIYLLCFNLIIVVFGFSLSKPMWENNHVFIRLLLLIFLLVAPLEWDRFSIDYLFALSRLTV
ncbi:MAG: DoxX family protein [Bacteroidota bacterium]|nr:DoxX family protein [Bacteroidota bacterium]